MKCSNALLGLLNIIASLLSLAILAGGIWLAVKHDTECAKLVKWEVIGVGAFLLMVSMAGLIGGFGGIRWLLAVYLTIIFLLILAVLAFTVFAVVVTNKGAGHAVSGKGYQEYRLGDYSTWLQRHVVDKPNVWGKIKSCLIDAKACKSLQDTAKNNVDDFLNRQLSPIQSGCCKPPTTCNFTSEGGTAWVNPTNVTSDIDCSEWNNDTWTLCYDCNSCRAGVLQEAKNNWKKLLFVNVAVLVLLILILLLGCCACANSRRRVFAGFYVKT